MRKYTFVFTLLTLMLSTQLGAQSVPLINLFGGYYNGEIPKDLQTHINYAMNYDYYAYAMNEPEGYSHYSSVCNPYAEYYIYDEVAYYDDESQATIINLDLMVYGEADYSVGHREDSQGGMYRPREIQVKIDDEGYVSFPYMSCESIWALTEEETRAVQASRAQTRQRDLPVTLNW